MAIFFTVVARGTTTLANHAWCGRNFLEVTEQILAEIPFENNKLTYSHGNDLFHYIFTASVPLPPWLERDLF
uniref:Longin domain-containing protein n=1 Tax=Vombatus ursinus TaxID=29139 RepID=A0A4X2K6R0_VOMUR